MFFKHPNRGPRRAALVAAAALAAGALAAPGAAHAGTYPMYSCNVPGHRTYTRGPWTINPSLNGGNTRLGALDQCASGGWFGVGKGAVGMDPSSMAGIGLSVPAGYSISQLKSYPLADLPGTGSPASVGNEIGGFDFLLWSSPATIDRTGPTNPYVQAVDAGTNSFWWTLFCGADAGQRCDLFSATPLVLQGIETTVSESGAPAAGIDGGTLTTTGAKKGTKTVAVTGTDAHSGVKKLEVLLDDTVLGTIDYSNDWTKTLAAQKPGTCAFADWHACPTTQSTTFSVDTTRVVDGAYALSVRATDPAGNVRTTPAPQAVTVDNTAPGAPAATSPTSVTTDAASTSITWSHPNGQVAPIVAAHVNVCMPSGMCDDIVVPVSGTTGGAAINRTGGYGMYTVSVALEDAAGNFDPAQARTYRVTFAQPAAPAPAPAPISQDPVTPLPGPAGPKGNDGAAGPSGANGGNGANAAAVVLHLNGAHATAAAKLAASFAGSTSRSLRSAYGKKVLITGRLVTPGGTPITGARVSVLQQDKMVGAQMIPAGEVVTDAAGRFRYVTTAVRSRTIRFAYRAHLEDLSFAQTTDISLGVVAKISLTTSKRSLRNGQAVVFRGTVAGAPRNARKVVELQVRKGGSWMTFRTTRLRNGRFSERYRFRRTRGRVTYVFRARVRQEAGFPFLTGVSRTAKVTVRG